jgi:hypothetical protein
MINRSFLLFLVFAIIFFSCSEDGGQPAEKSFQLQSVNVGPYNLNLADQTQNTSTPFNQPIVVTFSVPLAIQNVPDAIQLKLKGGDEVSVDFTFQDDNKTVVALPAVELTPNETYELILTDQLEGADGEAFPGVTIEFVTIQWTIASVVVVIDGHTTTPINRIKDVDRNPTIEITFPTPINTTTIKNTTVRLLGGTTIPTLSFTFSDSDKKITIATTQTLDHLRKYTLTLSPNIEGSQGELFTGYSKIFYTEVDPTPKKPMITDEELLTLVQQQTFKYFYDFAHPVSGMTRERNSSGDIVTSGGSGFGIMALIVGIERNFITRQQGLDHMNKILNFLETTNRFHGAWSHWINGNNGSVIPFSDKDNGGDLVETSFLIQGLITFRQYLNANDVSEKTLIDRINVLWQGVEWDWYTKGGENVLYWHWSPDQDWIMNHPIRGHNEAMITYVMAASSPTHSIAPEVYHSGYARSGNIQNGKTFYDFLLPLGEDYGGPLFFSHYSFLGLDPKQLQDQYANYWTQNVNHSKINHAYVAANPKNFVGYSDENWGLTASDNPQGYSAHSPLNDLGVISPTAALSSFPYTPEESMKALKFFYYILGDRLWGNYGFYDAFNLTEGWVANSYLAIDQGPIIVMIENHRSGLLWNLFMSAPEVQNGLTILGFEYE